MRPECLICGMDFESDTQVGGGADPKRYWICDNCRRHADIGKAVEAVLVEHSTFWIRQRTWMPGEPWQVSIPDVVECHEEIGNGSTPLAALRSAVKP